MSFYQKNQISQAHKLYQQALLKHHKNPTGFNKPIAANYNRTGSNLICGDEITLELQWQAPMIADIAFSGESCAICRASASLLCENINGLSIKESKQKLASTLVSLSNKTEFADEIAALAVVTQYPVRLQCALLPWHTLQNILDEIDHKKGSK